jgi:hypothetical protein
LVEALRGEWRAQLGSMIPFDRVRFWVPGCCPTERNVCVATSLHWTIQIREDSHAWMQKWIYASAHSEFIHRPLYEHCCLARRMLPGHLGWIIRTILLFSYSAYSLNYDYSWFFTSQWQGNNIFVQWSNVRNLAGVQFYAHLCNDAISYCYANIHSMIRRQWKTCRPKMPNSRFGWRRVEFVKIVIENVEK